MGFRLTQVDENASNFRAEYKGLIRVFDRAVSATKQTSGFSPCGMLFGNSTRIQAFFRSL
jgi:hypothetical protein